jgi:hypothetical protein
MPNWCQSRTNKGFYWIATALLPSRRDGADSHPFRSSGQNSANEDCSPSVLKIP